MHLVTLGHSCFEAEQGGLRGGLLGLTPGLTRLTRMARANSWPYAAYADGFLGLALCECDGSYQAQILQVLEYTHRFTHIGMWKI